MTRFDKLYSNEWHDIGDTGSLQATRLQQSISVAAGVASQPATPLDLSLHSNEVYQRNRVSSLLLREPNSS